MTIWEYGKMVNIVDTP